MRFVSGDNSYTGTIQVNAGTLIFNGSGNHTLTGSYTDAGTLEFRRHQPVRDRRDNRHHQFDLQRR
ncbi:hypothetical protein [Methylomonas koyamae]|uniref:hypothetical protein n=1 Tax=Methylomonas koyamae TaxID=702114 RepID=UPI00391AA498